jgi:PDZ domain
MFMLLFGYQAVAQVSIPGADRREQTALSLSKVKKPKGTNRSFSAVGNSKESLGVFDPTFAEESERQAFVNSLDYKALASDGFITVLTMDPARDAWLSRVCSDHFGPMEPLMKNGVAVQDPGNFLGFSLLVTCDGLQVHGVRSETPASRANIQSGDYLISLNGRVIHTRSDFDEMVRSRQSDSDVVLTVRRDNESLPIKVTVADVFKPKSQWPDAFSRRGYKLGITLSQFRNVPFPDMKEWPDSYSICTSDPSANTPSFSTDAADDRIGQPSRSQDITNMRVSVAAIEIGLPREWRQAEAVACKFFHVVKPDGFGVPASLSLPREGGLILGDLQSRTTFFFISEDGLKEPQLFRIDSSGPSSSYAELSDAFIAAYGAPSAIVKGAYQTKSGSTFTNEIATWKNESSSISLSQYGESTEVFHVTHLLVPLEKLFDAKLTELAAVKGKTL